MQPVVSVAEMHAADQRALAQVDEGVLVGRAGFAVAAAALRLLPHRAGRRVVVVAGRGNNGADGRVAAALLRRRGIHVAVVDASEAPDELPRCDLVVDAAYGTGFRGTYDAPRPPGGASVLAVDIPSGVSGDTGAAAGRLVRADRTVTMAAWKIGLLQGDGPSYSGVVEVADIGIPVGSCGVGLVEDADVARWLPGRPSESHKWASAVTVVAGSPGMEGASVLATRAAMRAGAGMVRLAVPGSDRPPGGGGPSAAWPLEAVRVPLPVQGWAGHVLREVQRTKVLVVGPGLGRDEGTLAEVREVVARCPVPVIADADALVALAGAGRLRTEAPVVVTPHDGEYRQLTGAAPGADRVAAARALARGLAATALVKGSLTAVAVPDEPASARGTTDPEWRPQVLLSRSGSVRLATAGTGDVLSGVIAGFVARGVPLQRAAALAAHVHGRAAARGPASLVAGDLPELVGSVVQDLCGG